MKDEGRCSFALNSIPSHILAAGVFKYLQWQDIGRLDRACTNVELRNTYLSDVYRHLRVKSLFFNSEEEREELSDSVLHWPVQSGAELLTTDEHFTDTDECLWAVSDLKKYRFTKSEAIAWAINRAICLDNNTIHLALYKFTPVTRSNLLKIFTSAASSDNNFQIISLWIAEIFDVENFLMDFSEALRHIKELNIPLRSFELWDFVSSLPSLDTLYLDEKCQNLTYGISTLLISNIRTKLRFLYLSNTEVGYSCRFFSNLENFKNLESLCVYNLNSRSLLHGKLDDILLPVLPNLLPNLKRLVLFRCPTISFEGIVQNLMKFVPLSASKLQYFQFEEIQEEDALIGDEHLDLDHMLNIHMKTNALQLYLEGCIVKYSRYIPEKQATMTL